MIKSLHNIEILVTDSNNYLMLHRNGCFQISEHLKKNFSQVVTSGNTLINSNPYWTVVRDPYERFISGIVIDLLQVYNNLDNLSKVLTNDHLNKLFYQNYSFLKNHQKGFLNHTALQWIYIFNQPLNFVVNIKDLDNFLDLHFKERLNSTLTNSPLGTKDIIHNFIENDLQLKNNINLYLSPDYYYLDHAKTQNLFWTWQDGKIF
tara:strand:- start:273 stop:887 length:615 start_codon:yes stop_codon:yes gene_type:complete